MVEILNSPHDIINSPQIRENDGDLWVNKNSVAFILLALLLGAYATHKITKETTEKKKDLHSVFTDNNIGTYYGTIKQIKIVDGDNDEMEGDLYKTFFEHYRDAQKKLQKLKSNMPELLNWENIGIERFLPLAIKESRLNSKATSSTDAYGYFQLKQPAITDINKLLKWAKVDTTWYSPNTNPADNIVYWILYFLKNKKEFEKKNPSVKKEDMDNFVYASYNAWLNKIQKLLEYSGEDNRDDFVKDIVKQMWCSWDYTDKESAYKVIYRNFFDKDYSKDTSVIITRDNIQLTKSKAQEMINYTEVISSIKKAVDLAKSKLTLYKTFEKNSGNLFQLFLEKKRTGELKLKDGTLLGNIINDILIDNNINPKFIPDTVKIYISKQFIEPYLDTNPYAQYDTVPYKDKYYLGKIIEDKINDSNFQKNVIDKVNYLKNIKDSWNIEAPEFLKFALSVAIINFNTKYRIWRAPNSSDDVWIPMDAKYYKDFVQATKKSAEETEKVDKENKTETTDITITHSDVYAEWDNLIYEENIEVTPASYENFMKTKVTKITSKIRTNTAKEKRAESIDKMPPLTNPTNIILHSTGWNIGDIPKVTAHFFVNKTWKIFMLTGGDGSLRQINHAWRELDPNYNAVWRGDKNITFKSIGIEVEAKGWEDWNEAQYSAVKELNCNLWWKYKIKKNHVLTHQQVATSIFWRWRKTDPYNLQRSKLWLPENYGLIDKDIASGNCIPNTTQLVMHLKEQWCSDLDIPKILAGIDVSIELARKSWRKLIGGPSEWKTSKEVLESIKKSEIKKSKDITKATVKAKTPKEPFVRDIPTTPIPTEKIYKNSTKNKPAPKIDNRNNQNPQIQKKWTPNKNINNNQSTKGKNNQSTKGKNNQPNNVKGKWWKKKK